MAASTIVLGAGTYVLLESKKENDRLITEVARLTEIMSESNMRISGRSGDDAVNGKVSDEAYQELEDDRSAVVESNRNGVIAVGLGVVCLGAASYWLYRALSNDQKTDTKKAVQVGLSPSAVNLQFSF